MNKAGRRSFSRSLIRALGALSGRETRKDRFSRYARHNRWSNEESVSGPGSTLEYTENIREELPGLFAQLRIHTILDAPCGDYNWFQAVDRPGVDYIGGDIVPQLVQYNLANHADRRTSFRELDIVKDPLPDVDLWICRDSFIHFSAADIFETLANFFRTEIAYLLTNSYPECTQNRDIRTGSFRAINLLLPPFEFPEPETWIDDWIEGFPVRRLGLWKRTALADALASRDVLQAHPTD